MKELKEPVKCPQCGSASPSGYNFCKIDGTPLSVGVETFPAAAADAPVSKCKCGNVIATPREPGFCIVCGQAWKPRNHVERQLLKGLAAVTDRGLEHDHNEDDVRIGCAEVDGKLFKVLVVCDGLSSAKLSEEASSIGAQAALDFLLANIRSGFNEPRLAMNQAIVEAHQAVCEIKYKSGGPKDPPGTTIVAAVLGPTEATIGWVGDSRAYFITNREARLLTHDHSWINQVVDAGLLTAEEAANSSNAHVIMHCIGPIETSITGNLPVSGVVTEEIGQEVVLLLCSDGLWNYAESIESFNGALSTAPKHGDALTLARHLITYATVKGGQDNISVAVASNGAW